MLALEPELMAFEMGSKANLNQKRARPIAIAALVATLRICLEIATGCLSQG